MKVDFLGHYQRVKDVIPVSIMSGNILIWSYSIPVEIVPFIRRKAHKTCKRNETHRAQETHEVPGFTRLLLRKLQIIAGRRLTSGDT